MQPMNTPKLRLKGYQPVKKTKKSKKQKKIAITIGYLWALQCRRRKNSISTPYFENYPAWNEILKFGVPRTRYLFPKFILVHILWSMIFGPHPCNRKNYPYR